MLRIGFNLCLQVLTGIAGNVGPGGGADTILMEDGLFAILLENGDEILLET